MITPITWGDDIKINGTMYLDELLGTVLNLASATIDAAVVSLDSTTIYVPSKTMGVGSQNADGLGWDMVFKWLRTDYTATGLLSGMAVIEAQVTLSGEKYTWYSPYFPTRKGNVA